MLPTPYLEKIGVYDVNMNNFKVKARGVDNQDVVNIGITELTTELVNQKPRVVGVDVKFSKVNKKTHPKLLLLQVGRSCLIIQIKCLKFAPESLVRFMNDQTVCFVGVDIGKKLKKAFSSYILRRRTLNEPVECKTGVEVGDLAAKILQRPDLCVATLQEICRDGVDDVDDEEVKGVGGSSSGTSYSSAAFKWNAKVFSLDEVKKAILEACTVNLVGKKLFSLI